MLIGDSPCLSGQIENYSIQYGLSYEGTIILLTTFFFYDYIMEIRPVTDSLCLVILLDFALAL